MSTLYPTGYKTQMVEMAKLKAMFAGKMHPEYARRLFAWIESKGGLIGIGSAWRPTPSGTSPASIAGHSFHQDQKIDGQLCIAAVDLVAISSTPGASHRSPTWNEVPVQGGAVSRDVGLHANVPKEPWHLQPIELDGWSTWNSAGKPGLFLGYPIPGELPPPPAPTPGIPAFVPENGQFSLWPLNNAKPRLAQEAFVLERLSRGYDNWTCRGDAVRYMQGVILHKCGGGITVDGYYGPVTAKRMEDLQKWFKLEVDGLVGPSTWGLIDALAVS